MANSTSDIEKIKELRKKIFITGYKGGMAHLASCFSCLEMLYALYQKDILRYDRNNSKWVDRDRFVLSKGHAGLALYCVLQEAGLISEKTYQSYLLDNAQIGGEPCMRDCEWIEATTGSLGHGLSMGLGMSVALKMDGSPAKVYVMMGDGELEEGTVWEAAMTAPALAVDNLIVIVDNNKLQKMDSVERTIGITDWAEKWSSFGWSVDEIDGHDIEAFVNILSKPSIAGIPRLVLANTIKGKGVSLMENNPKWHFRLPGKKELEVFMNELEITAEEME